MPEVLLSLGGIRAEGRHGANAGERLEPQAFLVDVDVLLNVEADSLEDTVDYRALAELVRGTVAGTSFELLESLASAVASALYDLTEVVEATAVVHKPNAVESLGVGDVSATVTID